MKFPHTPLSFITHAFSIESTAAPLVFGRVMMFGGWALVASAMHLSPRFPEMNISVAPTELAGAALGLLMVLRTNAGYDRWWEARKLWGSMVNATRSLAVSAAAYGPDDQVWRSDVARRIATFTHLARRSLRNERDLPEVAALLGDKEAQRLATADHMPTTVLIDLARLLQFGLADFQFLQADTLRAQLMDNLGGCERIAKTPLPLAYAIEVRRFIFLFLFTLPLVLFNQVPRDQMLWAVPLLTVMVAYPFLAIDKIGYELQHPFDTHRLNHLPLDNFTTMIERNVLAVLEPNFKGQ